MCYVRDPISPASLNKLSRDLSNDFQFEKETKWRDAWTYANMKSRKRTYYFEELNETDVNGPHINIKCEIVMTSDNN